MYFSVDQFPLYGRLSGRKLGDNRAGERVAIDTRKKNPADFALWKVFYLFFSSEMDNSCNILYYYLDEFILNIVACTKFIQVMLFGTMSMGTNGPLTNMFYVLCVNCFLHLLHVLINFKT